MLGIVAGQQQAGAVGQRDDARLCSRIGRCRFRGKGRAEIRRRCDEHIAALPRRVCVAGPRQQLSQRNDVDLMAADLEQSRRRNRRGHFLLCELALGKPNGDFPRHQRDGGGHFVEPVGGDIHRKRGFRQDAEAVVRQPQVDAAVVRDDAGIPDRDFDEVAHEIARQQRHVDDLPIVSHRQCARDDGALAYRYEHAAAALERCCFVVRERQRAARRMGCARHGKEKRLTSTERAELGALGEAELGNSDVTFDQCVRLSELDAACSLRKAGSKRGSRHE